MNERGFKSRAAYDGGRTVCTFFWYNNSSESADFLKERLHVIVLSLEKASEQGILINLTLYYP